MKTRLEEQFKSAVDRARTDARKHNVSFNESSVDRVWLKVSGADREHYPIRNIGLLKTGSLYVEYKHK
jgi:hypothetical protein